MPQYFHPGVYIEEIERGPRPIEGVPTSTAAFLGEAERGSVRPRLVTSYREYQRWFGDVFDPNKFLPYAASGFFDNGGKLLYVARVVGPAAATAQAAFGDFIVRAAGPGSWGNRVFVLVEDGTTKDKDGNSVGFRVRIAYWLNNQVPFDPFANPQQLPRPSLVEDFDDLVTNEALPDYYGKRMPFVDLDKGLANQGPESSALGVLMRNPGVAPGTRPANGAQVLSGGADDGAALTVADFEGSLQGNRQELQGLAALELDPYRDVALVYSPAAGDDVVKAIVTHCEKMRFRFAAIDSHKAMNDTGSVNPRQDLSLDTEYAAYYYPWIMISDPVTGARKLVPPGGHCLGVYARTDAERGVFKAPANEIVRGALALEYDLTDENQDVLNPRGVNAIRNFPANGIRIWGARTLTSNSLWKYVSVRRLFIFLERSIYEGTQWVVFEPNDVKLWARVTDTVRLFLRSQWRQGALFGRTEDQAFFITCDERTMTQDDILNGRLICEIGIAPVRPAEFVVFRIFQNTAETQR